MFDIMISHQYLLLLLAHAGETKVGLGHIKNVLSIQLDCPVLPLGLVAKALKEQGAVFVVLKQYVSASGFKRSLPPYYSTNKLTT